LNAPNIFIISNGTTFIMDINGIRATSWKAALIFNVVNKGIA